ncbi:potassium channel family protein [Cellulosilyticum sp. I15G10I2]|uniref:potassium channel family protein n=1 Tax=Cellulosilyticum sp. I15G10I2 TaxID=1892843 RepID=UPI00085C650A|nr:TrkA family potassium uptake protein [Cellulosilyticum sp. I15G10I2]
MKLFTQKKTSDYTIIIGCGRLGASLANDLSDRGGDVLIIDRNKDSFRKLSPSFGGLTLTGDAADIDILHEAQVEKATVVILVTDNDNTNIMIAQMAKKIFKKERVIARLYDPELKCVYYEFGIDTISPAVLSIKEINRLLNNTEKEEHI